MRLYVLRHGEAEERRASLADEDRKLTARGHAQARGAAALLASGAAPADERPARLFSSPAVRARQTAAPLERALELKAEIDPRIALDVDVGTALDLVGELLGGGAACVLVGHNPTLEDLVAHLGGRAELKKGQLVALEVSRKGGALHGREIGRFRSEA